jgi:hypothetical protein
MPVFPTIKHGQHHPAIEAANTAFVATHTNPATGAPLVDAVQASEVGGHPDEGVIWVDQNGVVSTTKFGSKAQGPQGRVGQIGS